VWFLTALAGAAAWGTADFVGGIAARRTPALSVLALSTPSGLLVVMVAGLLDGWTSDGMIAAVAAGVCSGIGLACLYAALGVGPMNIVAPASAVVGALMPVTAGLVTGERPGVLSLIGIAVSLGAVVLISREPNRAAPAAGEGNVSGPSDDPEGARRSGLLLALVAGLGIGLSLVFLEQAAGEESRLAPLLPARLVTWATVVVAILATKGPLVARKDARLLAVGAGLLDALAYVCYLLALRDGLLSVVGVLVSLYPAGTVLLARIVLGERTSPVQSIGLALAASGVALMVLG